MTTKRIEALLNRGDITWEEIQGLRLNTAEWHAVYMKLTDDALIRITQHNLKNCGPCRHLPCTYPETLQTILVPELLRRLYERFVDRQASSEVSHKRAVDAEQEVERLSALVQQVESEMRHWRERALRREQ
jgi:predicted ribosome quality control (RQC) complex YloA/Tae2 family protein